MSYTKCTETVSFKEVVVSENKRKFKVVNPRGIAVSKTRVDDCLISGNDVKKCDWLISIEDPEPIAHLIELKGCDIDRAIEQLSSTLKLLPAHLQEYKKKCYAVTKMIPKHGPALDKKKRQFQKRNSVVLSVKNNEIKVHV